jgi:hypothetical protein
LAIIDIRGIAYNESLISSQFAGGGAYRAAIPAPRSVGRCLDAGSMSLAEPLAKRAKDLLA